MQHITQYSDLKSEKTLQSKKLTRILYLITGAGILCLLSVPFLLF